MKHFPDDDIARGDPARDVDYVIVHGAFYEPAVSTVIAAWINGPICTTRA